MNLIHIIDCYYWIWIQSVIDNERCLWLWGSNANVNYGKIYSGQAVLKIWLGYRGVPREPQNCMVPMLLYWEDKVPTEMKNRPIVYKFSGFLCVPHANTWWNLGCQKTESCLGGCFCFCFFVFLLFVCLFVFSFFENVILRGGMALVHSGVWSWSKVRVRGTLLIGVYRCYSMQNTV